MTQRGQVIKHLGSKEENLCSFHVFQHVPNFSGQREGIGQALPPVPGYLPWQPDLFLGNERFCPLETGFRQLSAA